MSLLTAKAGREVQTNARATNRNKDDFFISFPLDAELLLGVEKWEPETAVEFYQLLALCYARTLPERKDKEEKEGLRQSLENARAKLFRLDMRAAAALDESLRR